MRVGFGQSNPVTLTAVMKRLGKKKLISDDVKSTKLEKSTKKRRENYFYGDNAGKSPATSTAKEKKS